MNESKTRPSKEDLQKLYLDERKSAPSVAKILGTSKSTVTYWLTKYNNFLDDYLD